MENKIVKILMIDDHQDNLTTLKALITETFSEVVVFSALNGKMGLELAAKEEPNVIFLDIIMPGMDGYEVCRKLKADNKLSNIPVVFVTATQSDKESRIKALECGAEAFLTKPIDKSELVAQIRAMLKISIANIEKINENERLAILVKERTQELEKTNKRAFDLLEVLKKENKARKTIQSNLQKSEATYHRLADNISDVVWIADMDMRITYVSPSVEKMIGTPPEEYMKMTLEEKFTPDSLKIISQVSWEESEKEKNPKRDKGRTRIIEAEHYRSDGGVIWISMHVSFLREKNGDIIGYQGVSRDITELKQSEQALHKSEEKYRSLFDQSITGIYLHDLEGRILDVNKAACLQLKYSKDELLNLSIFDLHPKKADTVNFPKEEILRQWSQFQLGQQGVFEGEHQGKDGTIIPVQISTGIVLYEGNKRIMAMVQDIFERKQAEKALIHSHNLMRYIIEHSRGAVAVHDRDLKYLYVSQRYLEDYKIKEKDIIGKHHYDVLPDIPQKWRDVHQKALMGEISSAENDSYEREDGSLEWTRWECRPWYESNGNIGGIIIYTEIITDRVKLLEDIKEKEYNLRIAQEIAHVGSFDYDPVGDKLVCSDVGLTICGITQKEFSGKTDAIIQFIHPEEREYALQISRNAVTEKKVKRSEFRIIRQDGEARMIDFRIRPVFDGNGNCVRITGTIQDITERKRAEENLIYINNHDHLTGLYNRRYFEEELRGFDEKNNLPLSIIMVDTNGLKVINDSFGHSRGDELLKKTAYTIQQACRVDDIIVRYGGDEFVIVLPSTNDAEALKIANSIKASAAQEKVANLELSISYGCATKHSADKSTVEILAKAENDMYSHKLTERLSMRSKQIEIVMNALFEKSHRESQHSIRVSKICEAIASKMNFEKQEVNQMRVAGLVHDIGKIGIDEKILNKTENLDIEERKEIEKHPEVGWRILNSSSEFAELAKYILHHHEKWNGDGYPNKLAGENIPIESRIITIADAYDAMTSERSYRAAISHEEAANEILKCSGSHFDPAIVDVFVNQVAPYSEFSEGMLTFSLPATGGEITFGDKSL